MTEITPDTGQGWLSVDKNSWSALESGQNRQQSHAGLMLVYEVVIGDMLVGKEGYKGLLCGWLGGAACNRPLVAGVVTAAVLVPAISFRCAMAMLDRVTKGSRRKHADVV